MLLRWEETELTKPIDSLQVADLKKEFWPTPIDAEDVRVLQELAESRRLMVEYETMDIVFGGPPKKSMEKGKQ